MNRLAATIPDILTPTFEGGAVAHRPPVTADLRDVTRTTAGRSMDPIHDTARGRCTDSALCALSAAF